MERRGEPSLTKQLTPSSSKSNWKHQDQRWRPSRLPIPPPRFVFTNKHSLLKTEIKTENTTFHNKTKFNKSHKKKNQNPNLSPQEDREPSTGSLEELLLPDRERSAKVQCVRFSDTQWTTKATTGEMYKFTFKKKKNKEKKKKEKTGRSGLVAPLAPAHWTSHAKRADRNRLAVPLSTVS